MKIVLIGYMGSGKSSVGKELSNKIRYAFKDLDNEIEDYFNTTISDFFMAKGEIKFRKEEARILKEIISNKENLVIATGGGTPCYGDTMDYLESEKTVITIYLKVGLASLTKRLFKEKTNRPLIAHLEEESQLNDFIRKHLFERSFFYNRANMVIDTEELSISQIVEAIIARLF